MVVSQSLPFSNLPDETLIHIVAQGENCSASSCLALSYSVH